ncbi:nuclease [Halobacillus andaensis]|uniref:Nuclease n=1 Tax=Halobacillus andaensis TaxID=1176239 RepID=A0A917EX05_HALAA|nr:nuclease-related domain-containing protein [Halobacillus andaensis]MBP2005651.1 hypothetical protein [Halobacillus andaensis]GGF27055.1 nuclease [Halobacillus andaensis]
MNFLEKLFGKKSKEKVSVEKNTKKERAKPKVAPERIGELGEYKINIQLDQFPPNYKHLNDLMLENMKTHSGFSQIDHVLLTPYGIFVIETKNYAGEIKGGAQDKQWKVNKKFNMMNPFHQNYGHMEAIKSCLNSDNPYSFVSMISFTQRAVFSISPELRKMTSDELCVYDTELTEFIKRKIQVIKLQSTAPIYKEDEIESIYKSLTNANVTDPAIREGHKQALLSASAKEDKCSICNKPVSRKVKKFCMSNKKFQGKIYCFDHQKNIS